MSVLSFGEILLRLSSPGYAKLFQKDTFDATFCGGEANVSVSLANYGINSSFITKLPDNDIAKAAVRTLNYFNVDTSKIIYGEGRMGLYYLEKGASQRPSKVIYDRKYSAISLAENNDFDWERIFNDVTWFHWTGINPALSDNMVEICKSAIETAKRKGITVSCDLNYRKTLWDSEKAKNVMSELLKYVDICIGNEEDAEKVLGIKVAENNIERGEINYNGYVYVASEICKQFGCKYVAFTLRESYSASRNGWSGMLYDPEDNKAYFSDKYDIQIVDRVGGGDSFTAGIIYGLINKYTNQRVIDFATAASCLKHTLEGDFNRVTVEEVEGLMKDGGNGRVIR